MKLMTGLGLLLLIGGIFKIIFFGKTILTSRPVPSLPAGAINAAETGRTLNRLRLHTAGLRKYLVAQKLNTSICFLADMSLPSGRDRFFVFDLLNDSVLLKGLVTHGSGRVFSGSVLYSNEVGSLCTSLGKYKVGKSYRGKFGLAYKLGGLDKTNSNAMKRFVVLHSHACVPETEVWPAKICMSWGCPTVSPLFLDKLAGYLDKQDKPILLWVFN